MLSISSCLLGWASDLPWKLSRKEKAMTGWQKTIWRKPHDYFEKSNTNKSCVQKSWETRITYLWRIFIFEDLCLQRKRELRTDHREEKMGRDISRLRGYFHMIIKDKMMIMGRTRKQRWKGERQRDYLFDPLGKARNWPGTTIEPKPEKHERFDYSASALEKNKWSSVQNDIRDIERLDSWFLYALPDLKSRIKVSSLLWPL